MSVENSNFKASSDPVNFKSFIEEAHKLLYISRANLFSGLFPFAERCTELHPEILCQPISTNEPLVHHHDYFKLMYITDASPGEHIINKKKYTLATGDLVIIPPAKNHVTHGVGIEVSCTAGYLTTGAGSKYAPLFFDWAYLAPWLTQQDDCLIIKPDVALHQSLTDAFNALAAADRKVLPESYLHSSILLRGYIAQLESCAAALVEILGKVFYSTCTPAQIKAFSKYRAPLISAISYIYENSARTITIDELCNFSGLKSSRLSQLFQEIIGLTIGDYIKLVRCQKARKLLANTTLPFGKIGLITGFHSAAYFTHVFKQFTGCTPKVYRNEFAIEWKD